MAHTCCALAHTNTYQHQQILCLLDVFLLQAMRLFVGVPVWTPHNRPQDAHPSRAKYLQAFGSTGVAAA